MLIGKDILLISSRLWDTFFDWYGGGPTLKWTMDTKDLPVKSSSKSTTSKKLKS